MLVSQVQRVRNLPRNLQRFFERNRAARDPIGECLPVDEFQHQGLCAIRLVHAVDARDVRVIERGEDFGFLLETCEPIVIGQKSFRELFQGDIAFEFRVACSVDLSHSADADQRHDFIGSETRTGPETHGCAAIVPVVSENCVGRTTIFIADDHPIFRQGLRQLIERDPGFTVVGEAADGPSALAAIERLVPRIAVLDIDMPGMDGLTAAARDRRLPTAEVCLTMHSDARFLNAALNAGAMGYVVKDGVLVEIVECLKAVAAGRPYVSPQLTTHLITRHRQASATAEATPGIEALTETERKVLRLIAEFKTTKDIASALSISPRTVDRHRWNMAESSGCPAVTP